jgi:hypothetical protein
MPRPTTASVTSQFTETVYLFRSSDAGAPALDDHSVGTFTVVGSPTYSADGVVLDGVDDAINIPSNSAFHSQPFTLVFDWEVLDTPDYGEALLDTKTGSWNDTAGYYLETWGSSNVVLNGGGTSGAILTIAGGRYTTGSVCTAVIRAGASDTDLYVASDDFQSSPLNAATGQAVVANAADLTLGASYRDDMATLPDAHTNIEIRALRIIAGTVSDSDRDALLADPYYGLSAGGGPAPITGDLGATETGSDAAGITGTVEPIPATGDLSATEIGSDAAAIDGDLEVSGDLGATETGADSATINGSIAFPEIRGDVSAAESGDDTAALSGSVAFPEITGNLAGTETGSDSAAIFGSAPTLITGDLAAVEVGSDSAGISGTLLVSGTLTATEVGADQADLDGALVPFGAGFLSAEETGSDGAAVTGSIRVVGTLEVTEGDADSATITGTAPALITGTLEAFEVGSDSAQVVGSIEINGTLVAAETGSDSALFRERELSVGQVVAVETDTDVSNIAGLLLAGPPPMYQTTLDVNYQQHGQNVIYRTVSGSVAIVRAIVETEESQQPSDAEVSVRYPTYTIRIRATQLENPERGATVNDGALVYTVDGFDPVDSREWRLYARA